MEGMAKKMSTLYLETAKYFAFDPKKYTMEEFFGDIKAFIASFNVSFIYCYCFYKYDRYNTIALLSVQSFFYIGYTGIENWIL